MQSLQGGIRFNSELLAEHCARGVVHGRSLDHASCAVLGEHRLQPESLPERVARCQLLQFRDQFEVLAPAEPGVEAVFERCKSGLLELRDERLGEVLVPEVLPRVAAPQTKCRLEDLQSPVEVTVREEFGTICGSAFEADRIDPVRLDDELVARPYRPDPSGIVPRAARGERVAELRYVVSQCPQTTGRRVTGPGRVQELLGADDPSGAGEQHAEDHPLLRRVE